MMKKMRLEIDELAVESFPMAVDPASTVGTVKGNDATIGLTCPATCAGPTCVTSCGGGGGGVQHCTCPVA
jgi:hypothetical protein